MRVHMSLYRLLLGVGFVGLAALAISWGREGSLSEAMAKPPAPSQSGAQPEPSPPVTATAPSSDYSLRVVAYIYEASPITREELGEYLIARMGAERLNQLVNKRIIEHVCQQKGIEVTAAEVEADLAETLKGLGSIAVKDFVDKLLKPYNKTLYEWKEDVIKPRLLLSKLCRDRVQVTEKDLQDAFEAYHGEQIQCRIIMWPSDQERRVLTLYPKLRDSEEEFERAAKQQADPKLASSAGLTEPFRRHTSGNEEMEKAAFGVQPGDLGLQPGELSHVIKTPQGLVVMKCVKRLPPDGKKLEDVRDDLTKDIITRKINQQEIPKLFSELRAQANPRVFLKAATTEEELVRDVKQELQPETHKSAATLPAPPQGN